MSRRSERGAMAGGEALAFSVLILLAGSLVITHVWSVIETRVALDVAAREYLRAYTRQTEHHTAAIAGEHAARGALTARGTPLTSLRISPPEATRFGPCGRATVTLGAAVLNSTVPFMGKIAGSDVRVVHEDLIPAHRAMTAHPSFDPAATPCDDG